MAQCLRPGVAPANFGSRATRGARPNSPMQTTSVCLEQAALVEVFDQGGKALVEARQQAVLQGVENVVVRVPAVDVGVVGLVVLAAVGVVPDDVDIGHAGFDQAAGQEQRLARAVAAVAVAERCRLGVEVESLREFRARPAFRRPGRRAGSCRAPLVALPGARRSWSSVCLSVRRSFRRTGGKLGLRGQAGNRAGGVAGIADDQRLEARGREIRRPGRATDSSGTSAGPFTCTAS